MKIKQVLGTMAAAIALAACAVVPPPVTEEVLPTVTPEPTVTPLPPTATPVPTLGATTTPDMPARTDAPEVIGDVAVFPGPVHYEGDVLSFEMPLGSADAYPDDAPVQLSINAGEFEPLQAFAFRHVLLGDRLLIRYAWDTSGYVGTNLLEFLIPQDDAGETQTVALEIEVLPADERPDLEQDAEWVIRETDCCELMVISGTAAARDLDVIADIADESVAAVEERLGFTIENKPVPIAMIDNVWGNGGYAADELVVSYVDRDYTAKYNTELFRLLMVHEAVHWATKPLHDETPTLLIEGIAVYVTGGHYKQDPIPERTAALLEADLYIPLADLADDFRGHQHEIAYVQGAGLVAYLVETYGWEAFIEMYATDDLERRNADWLDASFERAFGAGLQEVEAGFIAWLEGFDPGEQTRDMILTINLFEALREYQRTRNPYETFPPIRYAIDQDITASFTRQTNDPTEVAIETLLIAVGQAINNGDYDRAEALLRQAWTAVDLGTFVGSPAAEHLAAAQSLMQRGYTPQRITLREDGSIEAIVTTAESIELEQVELQAGEWVLTD